MKRMPLFYVVLSSVAAVSILCSIAIPEIGKFTLLNELFGVMVMGSVIIMLVRALIASMRSRKISNTLLLTVVILVIGIVAGSKSIKSIKDFASGPEWITISNCEVEKRSTSRGIFSLNYYLKGEDSSGNEYRFRVSGKEYDALNGEDEVSVLCYRNTGRVVEIKR